MEGVSNDSKVKLLRFDHESDSDESLSDVECDLCSKSFSSVNSYEQHLKSRKHHQMLTNEKVKKNMAKLAEQTGSLLVDPSNAVDDDPSETLSCKICSKSFSGYVPYANHMKSNIHNKNLLKEKLKENMKDLPEVLKNDDASDEDDLLGKPYARCTPCKKTFYDPNSYSLHLKGIQHEKKMKSLKVLESLKPEVNGEVNDDDGLFHRCNVCQKEFTGPVPYKTHLHGSYHQRELQRSKVEEELKDSFTRDPESQKLVCKECNKGFTDAIALKAHLANNNHEKQKAKEKIFSFVSSNPEIVAAKSVQNLSDDDEESDAENNYRHGAYFFVCKLCKCSFSGPESARAHLESKKHVQAKNEKDLRRKMKTEKEQRSDQENTSPSVNKQKDKDSDKKSSEKHEAHDDFELV